MSLARAYAAQATRRGGGGIWAPQVPLAARDTRRIRGMRIQASSYGALNKTSADLNMAGLRQLDRLAGKF
jgi:hypothetical protein